MAGFLMRVERRSATDGKSIGRKIVEMIGGADRASMVMAADSSQKQKQGGGGGDEDSSAEGEGGQKLSKKGEDLKDEMDALVDDIDAVLEENAEEFVKNYVQRGGQLAADETAREGGGRC